VSSGDITAALQQVITACVELFRVTGSGLMIADEDNILPASGPYSVSPSCWAASPSSSSTEVSASHGRLPRRCGHRLRFFGELTQSEIGQELGISQMHVSRLLSRTLASLRRNLAAS